MCWNVHLFRLNNINLLIFWLQSCVIRFIRTQEAVQRVSVERVVSGLGMPRIYDFLASRSPHLINAEITRAMQQRDPGSVITKSGLGKKVC